MSVMHRIGSAIAVLCLAIVPGLSAQRSTPSLPSHKAHDGHGAQLARLQSSYGKLPIYFEENAGQTNQKVRFLSRGVGYAFFITGNETVAVLSKLASPLNLQSMASGSARLPGKNRHEEGSVLRMKLIGANDRPAVRGEQLLEGKSNYFVGSNPAKWRTSVLQYGKVRLSEIYPGIDLVYYGDQTHLEYDFVVRPGADPRKIRLQFDGAERIEIEPAGDLVLEINGGIVRQELPAVYQEYDGRRYPVRAAYHRLDTNQFGVDVEPYDASRPLVIDPIFTYSTYLGGNNTDQGLGIAVDGAGSAYVTGYALSPNFPTTDGVIKPTKPGTTIDDAFVTKLNPAGSALVYSTYVGGSGSDEATAIAVDSAGNASITGETSSTDFPTVAALQATYGGAGDAFVAKLNSTGSALVYSTYLGGTGNDFGSGIALDITGAAVVVGGTRSTDLQVTPRAYQSTNKALGVGNNAFIAKLSASGSTLSYCTYLGGSNSDDAIGVAVDSSGNAYVAGAATSLDFPTSSGSLKERGTNFLGDGFVAKLTSTGDLFYSTYLGGSGADIAQAIAQDGSGSAYVTGYTSSTDFPTTPGVIQGSHAGGYDAFVAKLNHNGSAVSWSTYLGGSSFDQTFAIAVDNTGSVFVAGATESIDFPTTREPMLQEFPGGAEDAFVTKLNATGTVLPWSTYLGGKSDESGTGIALDSSGNVYVIGDTSSTNFPVTTGAFQVNLPGMDSVFVTKIPPPIVQAPVERKHAVKRD